MSRVHTLVAGAAAMGALAFSAASAQAALACGDTLTEDTKLHKNLVCEPGEGGLTIGANGVKLDLNGHAIVGEGVLTEAVFSVNRKRTTIVGGKIRGWDIGVDVGGGEDLTVSDLEIEDTAITSVRIGGVVGATITGTVLRRPVGDNITVYNGAEDVEIADNKLIRGGMSLDGGSGHRVTGNEIAKTNGVGIGARSGIALHGVADVLLRGNHIEDAASSGIALGSVDGGVRVDRNTIEGGGAAGVSVITLSTGVKITRNTVLDSGGDGIYLAADVGAEVRNNVAKRADDDGIENDDDSTLVTGNTANGNTDYGIDSASASPMFSFDNIAKHNGNPAQCAPAGACNQ